MIPYDVSADDEPLDVAAVGSDDDLIESLRCSLSPESAVVWDDDDDEVDPAVAVLRVLQRDVAADLPAAAGLLPADVTALAPRQRRFGRTATIAAVTAGVLSIGGGAAAAAGSPFSEVRRAVSSVVSAITPEHPVGPVATTPRHSDKPSPSDSLPGQTVSAGARSTSATGQIATELDKAARFIDQGKDSAADNQLDAAARKLPLVLDASTSNAFAARITALRARLAGPHPRATHEDARRGGDATGHGSSTGDAGRSDDSKGRRASATPEESASPEKSGEHATSGSTQQGDPKPSRTPHAEKSSAPKPDSAEHAADPVKTADDAGTSGR